MSSVIGGGPPVQIISPRNLPPRLTLLQLLVWIATRNPTLVLRMSLKEREVERANKSLREPRRVCRRLCGLSYAAKAVSCN
jgi:hypothetical protein